MQISCLPITSFYRKDTLSRNFWRKQKLLLEDFQHTQSTFDVLSVLIVSIKTCK